MVLLYPKSSTQHGTALPEIKHIARYCSTRNQTHHMALLYQITTSRNQTKGNTVPVRSRLSAGGAAATVLCNVRH
eukprot:610042-Rhodomonas_salina.2